ncbi:aldehyde ferredoxin oxidoreductase family protein [Fervidicoccus fontis]|uniref:Aldehyde ferredoxin oxidoreductase family protein n=1 Tax=Fervidicoccus fontis TaxID=683846 RepID=A0A843AH71_9CREN|nr:aldehyde ferredoxin oxidoreductase family protein [Fervidicoccus fontis]MBE9390939.1 aldehyde ferredoxin oxidoreductase family protein [Fervidicoccus fontis]
MYGNWGKILRVNLTEKEIKVDTYEEGVARKWLGSRGLGIYLLLKEMDPKVDPLGPENKLIIAAGPLTGTPAPTGGRYNVITKSPLTGYITFSNSGGYFGAELKKAGYDAIVVEGASDKPVYLYINDEHVELRDASHLWGKKMSETEAIIKKELNEEHLRVAGIGPAGENLVRFASIMNDVHRAAGRGGPGAVMGSKKLKAIAVKGSKEIPVADKNKFMNVVREKVNKIRNDPVGGGGLPKYGTAVLVNIINENGLYPTRNFQTGVFQYAYEQSGEALAEKYLIRNNPCFACPIGCGRVTKLPTVGQTEGPEYETIYALGSTLGINDLATIVETNHLADEYGLDTISLGGTIATAMELYEKGYIKEEDLQKGPPLRWGNTEVLHYYIEKIVKKEGFGKELAEGGYRLAKKYNAEQYFMGVKKLELPAYDPRGAEGHGLGYATNNRGGCHVKNYMISPEILGYPYKMDPHDISDAKINMLLLFQHLTAIIDSAGLCLFTTFGLGADDYTDLLNAALGWNLKTEDYLKIGERIWNAERLFNLKAGLDPLKEDTLPKRFLEEPMPEGPNKGRVVRLKEMLPRYYKMRGWTEDGRIPREKLKELELEQFA